MLPACLSWYNGTVLTILQNILTPGSNGDRTDVPDVVILITNSQSNNVSRTLTEAWNSRIAGEYLIAVGVGNWLNVVELDGIASWPYQSNRLLVPGGYGNLSSILSSLRNIICISKYE